MLRFYVIVLCLGVVLLLVAVFAGSLGRSPRVAVRSARARRALGGALGFGMGGIAAEYSPLDFAWPVSLALAVVGAAVGAIWVGYATRAETSGDDTVR